MNRLEQREAQREARGAAAVARVNAMRRARIREERKAYIDALLRHPLVVVAFGLGLARVLGLG